MLGVWYSVSECISARIMAFFTDVSSKITSFYCIHWVFVRTITNVILYIKNGTQVLPVWKTLVLSVCIILVTLVLTDVWRNIRIRMTAERSKTKEEVTN
jgi:hypothetical protein